MAARNESNELRIIRVYDAPLSAVWDAWTIPEQVAQWWGPRGFTITTHGRDLRTDGSWRYTMHGPDGVDYPNVTRYLLVEPKRKLVYDHGASDDRPPLFRVTVTFTESGGKTTMEMISAFATPVVAAEMAKFIRKAGGTGTWDRLAEHLAEITNGQTSFVINRAFEAPVASVFEMWTDPDRLAKWLPPVGASMRFLRSEIAEGRSTLFAITGPEATMHVHARYLAIDPSRRIVYAQQFVDENERPAPPPGTEAWPQTLRMNVLFAEEAPDQTRVTVTTEADGEASAQELSALAAERGAMTRGWTGSFDVLEELLAGARP